MEATTTRTRSFMIAALAAIMAVFAALAVALPQQAFAAESALTAGQIGAQAPTDDESVWDRLAGATALDTMSVIVDEGWTSSDVAVLTTFDGYWDALTAAGVAGQAKAPVLMTEKSGLSAQTAQVLAKLKPSKIIVVGGPAAVPEDVAQAAVAATGVTTTIDRLAGENAIGTANDVFRTGPKMVDGSWNSDGTAFVATNDGYWDALAAAPVSYAKSIPIFLADGHSSMTADTIEDMKAGGISNVYVLGGEVAIEPSVVEQLTEAGFTINARLGGETAIGTSEAIATTAVKDLGMSADKMGIATIGGYWDALSGAALCGSLNAPIVLAENETSSSITGFVTEHVHEIAQGYIFGGEAALPLSLDPALEAISSKAGIVTIHFVVPEGATAPADMQIEYDTMVRDSALFNGGAKEWPHMANEAGESIYWYTSEDCGVDSAVGPKTSFTADATVYGKFQPYFTVAILNADGTVALSKSYTEESFAALASESADAQSANWNTTRVQTATEYVTFADLVNDAAGDSSYWAGLNGNATVTYGASDATASRTVDQVNGAMFYSDITDAESGAPMSPCFGISWKSGSPAEGQSQGDVAAQLAAELEASPSTAQSPRAFPGTTAAEQAEGKTPGGMQMLSSCLSLTVTLPPETVTVHFVVPEGATAPADMQIEYDTMVRDSALFNGGAKEWPHMAAADGSAIYWYTSEACDTASAVGPKSSFTADATVYGKFLPYFSVSVVKADGTEVLSKSYDEAAFKALASEGAPQSANWNGTRVQTATEYVTFADLVNDAAGDASYWGGLAGGATVTYGAADAGSSLTVDQVNGAMFYSDITDAATGAPMSPCFGLSWKSGSPAEGQSQGDVAAQLADELKASPSYAQSPRAFVSPTADQQAAGETPRGMQVLSSCLSLTVTLA